MSISVERLVGKIQEVVEKELREGEECNGWRNVETWAVFSHISNDQNSVRSCKDNMNRAATLDGKVLAVRAWFDEKVWSGSRKLSERDLLIGTMANAFRMRVAWKAIAVAIEKIEMN